MSKLVPRGADSLFESLLNVLENIYLEVMQSSDEEKFLSHNTEKDLEIILMMIGRSRTSRLCCNHFLKGIAWKEMCTGEIQKCGFLDTCCHKP